MYCKECKYGITELCSLSIAHICEGNSRNDKEITNEGIFKLLLYLIEKR